jgi:superfamily II DNA or RNA helicase
MYEEEGGLLVAAVEGENGTKVPLKKKERQEALQKRIVFASLQLAKKGLDKPEMDTLILPFPVGDKGTIQQMFGRIQREHPNKKEPYVVVFEDNIDCMIKACNSIREYCRAHEIEYKIIGEKNEKPGAKDFKEINRKFKPGMFRRKRG